MKDFLWGVAVAITNRLQEWGLMSPERRAFLRKVGHVFVSAPNERVVTTRFGYRLRTPSGHKGSRSYASGTYEERLSEFLASRIKQGERFVDVGAFVGFYACLAARNVGERGQVWAFEPENMALRFLKSNVEMNNFRNVICEASAVGDWCGEVGFSTSVSAGVGPAGGFVSSNGDHASGSVKQVSLDQYFGDVPSLSLDWLKLDTDGHELQALDGMHAVSARSPALKLVLEVDPSHFSTQHHMKLLYQKLRELGFSGGLIAERRFEEISLSDEPLSTNQHLNVIFFKTQFGDLLQG